MGVLNDAVLSINAMEIESITSDELKHATIVTESTAKRHANVTRCNNSATHCLYVSYVVLDNQRRRPGYATSGGGGVIP